MNPLQRTIIEKAGHDNGFEHVLSSAGDAVILASARHRSQAAVTALAGGFEVRFQPATPALLPELLRGFQLWAGADDVFRVPTLADLAALLRRAAGLPFFTLPTLTISDLTLDPATRTVQVGILGPKRLTQLEFRLLYALMIHRGQVLPAEILVEQVWGYTGEGERDLVRGLIRRLRAKIEPDPSQPRFILTIAGIGYTFDPQG